MQPATEKNQLELQPPRPPASRRGMTWTDRVLLSSFVGLLLLGVVVAVFWATAPTEHHLGSMHADVRVVCQFESPSLTPAHPSVHHDLEDVELSDEAESCRAR